MSLHFQHIYRYIGGPKNGQELRRLSPLYGRELRLMRIGFGNWPNGLSEVIYIVDGNLLIYRE